MTLQLPRPGSIWLQVATCRMMRVIYSEAHDVIAHDAELIDRIKQSVSWCGAAEDFFRQFEPANPNDYPKTAS